MWQYYRDEQNYNLVNSKSFKSKIKITGRTPADGNEMPLINCEVSLMFTWSSTCVITNSTGEGKFEITDTKLYVPLVTLLTQDNAKLLQQLKSGFKRVVNWNNYFSKPESKIKSELKSTKSKFKSFENIRKIATGQGDDYTTGCLLDYPYFNGSYKMIAIDLSKQQALDADPRAIQQINFTANLDRAVNTRIYLILEETKETILNFAQGTIKVLQICCVTIFSLI